ncbi:hypothetical protein PF005_g17301 [Phytophthora fragariae]|uniref:Uncharacterized protein n=1 Tax=Phytophthora fragariae TaxID=53985 RepID=A0A6A3X2M3_9STRA|nr:hypothetical protein PF003_g19341 [Phytophthora fragariae]KAE8931413.1 hypothetical protein PF009_g18527 [Phytophthora fragariae]KAE9095530.1 hypothetical protein PF007_g17342 [Phytophthora fragariae]KAE9128675.1 hypothetical protein PF006_g16217 [Phytophthora fragariae]KAE9195397.1 hypothetical protein PF005_g17301 [Phytophthora fragariae]
MEDSCMDVEVAAPEQQVHASEPPLEPSDGDVTQQFAGLYMSKLLAKLREGNKTPQAAAAELQDALRKLHELQQEFVTKQAKQNLLDRLAEVKTLEALQKVAASNKAAVGASYEQEKRELEAAVRERREALRMLERMADEVEQEKRNVIEHEHSRAAHESELAQLNEVWKEIQKRNAHRKAAVQVATGVMITDEDDCNRVLDQQTQSIQEMDHKQKLLEDEKIDISTQVKRTKHTIENLSKQNDLRSKDAEMKQREQDYMTLQQMKQWYDHVRSIQESLSGMEIMKVAGDYLEVRVLKSHLVRLFCDPESTCLQRVQFLTPDEAAMDLVDVAVRDNNVQYLLCEYRERVREHLAL